MSHESPTEDCTRQPPLDDGSEPLEPKREKFVRGLFEGLEPNQAYVQAGYKRPRGNAWRMYREPEVQARLEYLRRELDQMEMANRAYRRRELRKKLEAIVYTDRSRMFEDSTYDGSTRRYMQMRPIDQLSEQERGLIEGVGDGGRPVMPSILSAAAQLARLDGLDAPTKIAPTTPDGESLSDGESLQELTDAVLDLSVRLESIAKAEEESASE